MSESIEFSFPSPKPNVPLVYFLPDGIYEFCPECEGAANFCLRCLDEGLIPHTHDS